MNLCIVRISVQFLLAMREIRMMGPVIVDKCCYDVVNKQQSDDVVHITNIIIMQDCRLPVIRPAKNLIIVFHCCFLVEETTVLPNILTDGQIYKAT